MAVHQVIQMGDDLFEEDQRVLRDIASPDEEGSWLSGSSHQHGYDELRIGQKRQVVSEQPVERRKQLRSGSNNIHECSAASNPTLIKGPFTDQTVN